MNRRIPAWIAIAASGVLVAASALAQGQGSAGGDNPKPSGDNATQSTSATTPGKSMRHASAKHAKAKHAKHTRHATTTSSSGTSAAGGTDRGLNAAMAQCADKTDRRDRAECARNAWESRRGSTS